MPYLYSNAEYMAFQEHRGLLPTKSLIQPNALEADTVEFRKQKVKEFLAATEGGNDCIAASRLLVEWLTSDDIWQMDLYYCCWFYVLDMYEYIYVDVCHISISTYILTAIINFNNLNSDDITEFDNKS